MSGFKKKYFILAPSFHGATLLAKFLNGHPEIICLGDTYPELKYDQQCGCEELVSKCGFWDFVYQNTRFADKRHNHILSHYPKISGIDKLDIRLYNFMRPEKLRKVVSCNRQREFVLGYESFVQGVYDGLSCSRDDLIFVDGVKSAHRVKALFAFGSQVDGIIHIVRNAGDFSKSSSKKNDVKKGFFRSLVDWRRVHSSIKRLEKNVPYIRVSYESLCCDTESEISKIFQFMGKGRMTPEELKENMKKEWHFMGNSSLFDFDGAMHLKKYDLSQLENRLANLIGSKRF